MIACIWASCADTAGPFCPESPPELNLNYGGIDRFLKGHYRKDTDQYRKKLIENPLKHVKTLKYQLLIHKTIVCISWVQNFHFEESNRCWVSSCQTRTISGCWQATRFKFYFHLVVKSQNYTTDENVLWCNSCLFGPDILGWIIIHGRDLRRFTVGWELQMHGNKTV